MSPACSSNVRIQWCSMAPASDEGQLDGGEDPLRRRGSEAGTNEEQGLSDEGADQQAQLRRLGAKLVARAAARRSSKAGQTYTTQLG